MNKIFIEAKKAETAECNFLSTIIAKYFPTADVEFVLMNGVGNLFNETNVNLMMQAREEDNNVIVILDADSIEKCAGFVARHKQVSEKKKELGLEFSLFLYPNNNDDGDVEVLMEQLARKDLHDKWWDCFNDYEKCIAGVVDAEGNKLYKLPNRKAKLHTYISSQQLSNAKRNKLGNGNWLFDNKDFWDLTRTELTPLLDFLKQHLR